MRAAQGIEGKSQNFLGGGLAGAAGDSQDLGVTAGAGGACKVFQPALRMAHREHRPCNAVWRAADQRSTRLRVKGSAHEVVAIAAVALQRHKQIAFLERARVDGKPAHAEWLACPTQGCGFGFSLSPQAHAARPPRATAAAIACSRSEKGCTSPRIYWPVSWPLPATTSTSPAFIPETAARMASARSLISRAPGADARISW